MINRTHTCGEITLDEVGSEVCLNGWIGKTRDLGSLIFIDLRDRYGITQLAFNIDDNSETPVEYGIRSIPTLLIFKNGKVIFYRANNISRYLAKGQS